jgi:hypothetical protein
MRRQGRLASARSWLPKYSGKNVLKGYCKHFGVDWRCAAAELQMLGVKIDPAYLAVRERTDAEKTRQDRERKQRQEAEENAHWHPYTDPYAAYLAGDLAALHDLELRSAGDEDDPPDRLDSPL